MTSNCCKSFGAILIGVFLAGSAYTWADDVEEGRAAIDAGQYEKARRLLLPKAKEGNAAAQNAVGALYRFGLGVRADYSEALEWFRKAAAQGNPRAQFNIGQMYGQGQGVERDPREEAKWYRSAAEQGFPPAQTMLGASYALGNGVPQDWAEAMKWYRRAADQGEALAQSRVGLMYAEGQGTPKDYAQAEVWFRKAAAQQHPAGQTWLGLLYLNGWGVKGDVAEAKKWLRLAADQEAPEAQYQLGSIYAEGKDGAPDTVGAIMWLRRASMYGQGDAQRTLKQRFDLEPDQGPLLVHPDQAIRASSDALAKGYVAVSFTAKLLEPAALGGFRATLVTHLDGRVDTITASNAVLYLAGYRDRLRVYGLAIERRGYKAISGIYRATATSSCGQIQSIWARGIQEGRLDDLEILQDGFNARLVHRFQLGGEAESFEMLGVVVESALAFRDPGNSDYGFLAEIVPEKITVRPDVDAILAAWPNWLKAPSRKDLSECVVAFRQVQR